MQANERRQAILTRLQDSFQPITASQFANEFSVSRQVIVGDIALLRASNHDILATNQGYLLTSKVKPQRTKYRAKLAVHHTAEQSEEELRLIVDNGGAVEDIQVDHPFYGLIVAPLQIRNHHDIDQFLEQMRTFNGSYLSSLTDGIHIHTISCSDKKIFLKVSQALGEAGLLLSED